MTANRAHTPTTADIRSAVTRDESDWREAGTHFDRWYQAEIAAAEQRGAARALREAADEFAPEWPDKPDLSATRGVSQTRKWLRNRADQMEGDGGRN